MSNFYLNTSFDNPAIISNDDSLFDGVISSGSNNYYIYLSTIMPIEFKDRKDLGKIVNDSIDSEFKLNASNRLILPWFEEDE
jgi:hypothetical protein